MKDAHPDDMFTRWKAEHEAKTGEVLDSVVKAKLSELGLWLIEYAKDTSDTEDPDDSSALKTALEQVGSDLSDTLKDMNSFFSGLAQ